MQLSQKRKILLKFFFLHFLNLDSILKIFKRQVTLIADVFLNLRTKRDVVRQMSKKSCFRGPFDR